MKNLFYVAMIAILFAFYGCLVYALETATETEAQTETAAENLSLTTVEGVELHEIYFVNGVPMFRGAEAELTSQAVTAVERAMKSETIYQIAAKAIAVDGYFIIDLD